MGSYSIICNIDKKERLEPHSFGDGAKFAEMIYGRNTAVATLWLLNERWAGNRIRVVLDSEPTYEKTKDYTDISFEVLYDMISSDKVLYFVWREKYHHDKWYRDLLTREIKLSSYVEKIIKKLS